jgi:hypothetical protein
MATNVIIISFNNRAQGGGQSDAMGAYVTQNAQESIQSMSFLLDRLDELAFICEETHRNGSVFHAAGRQTIIAAAENFMGHRLCREQIEWKAIKSVLEALSRQHPNILILPGTAKKYTNSRFSDSQVNGAPACRVVHNGRKILNVYKAKGAGNVDRFPERMDWNRVRLIPNSIEEKNKSRHNVFRWGQPVRSCGVEICNDARSKILHNDSKRPRDGLNIVFWLTNVLFMNGYVAAANNVQSDCFPCAQGGHIIHASGSGMADHEISYPTFTIADDSGDVTAHIHNQQITDNRLYFGVYGPYAHRNHLNIWSIKPTSYYVLSSTNNLLIRAFIWQNLGI